MAAQKQHGGKREGAGRPKGSLNRRSLEAIREVAERYPDWTPLMHLAAVANDETLDHEIRLDAAKAAAPYCHAKLRPVVADADELVELEGRLHAARLHAAADALAERPGLAGLAERLARADAREAAAMVAEARRVVDVEPVVAPDPLPVNVAPAVTPASVERAPVPKPAAVTEPPAAPGSDAIIAAKPEPYRPVLDWPDEQAFADTDYSSFEGGFLAGRNR